MTDPSMGLGGQTTMPNHAEKAAVFQALHARPGAFVIPNPWDAGTGLPGDWGCGRPSDIFAFNL